ncbi:type II restriction endonuclease subunit M [Shimia abyssi]|uniref:Type II restriction endonuclease subunit M n=1 Tax=Shimia abyssi TaxID=1662395 RepID=A0A2P8F6F7_9RHOB|nr:type II restriction endonuclease subunit M [Shimia abyssi]PSL17300.1 hypothetical protein CLV88_11973 [Shimia abyssi]
MTVFLRLMGETEKETALRECCIAVRTGNLDPKIFEVEPSSFRSVPGAPFAYWVSDTMRELFARFPRFQSGGRIAASGGKTLDDFRFIRAAWEVPSTCQTSWKTFAKGGIFSPYYADVFLRLSWHRNGDSLKAYLVDYRKSRGWSPNWTAELHSANHYFRPGITWPRRTNGLSFRAMPKGSIFGDKGPAVLTTNDDQADLLFLMGILNSKAFAILVSLQLARTELAQSFEVGVVQNTPVPECSDLEKQKLVVAAKRAWSCKRSLDYVQETSSAFQLPAALQPRLGHYDQPGIEVELSKIQTNIDEIVFGLYGLNEEDRAAALSSSGTADENDNDEAVGADVSKDDNGAEAVDVTEGLLSWAAGVAFGRFDWRLATGERTAPSEPEPFDPLPAKSPGMLPDDAVPFHPHSGILVDDQGHSEDLARLIEEVLARIDESLPTDVRRWIQRDFFSYHLRQYSKRPRKAPIYWPISTSSGSYTLWLYYPSLTDQTLFTAINDFIEPKLEQVGQDVSALRNKGTARSAADERSFEKFLSLEAELRELREALLEIAPSYHPNHDDGVQITSAPLWRHFRHTAWRNALKATWEKLESGDYEWAHLAMVYWPDRVREKCKTDKSLAIAHNLEALYEEPEAGGAS